MSFDKDTYRIFNLKVARNFLRSSGSATIRFRTNPSCNLIQNGTKSIRPPGRRIVGCEFNRDEWSSVTRKTANVLIANVNDQVTPSAPNSISNLYLSLFYQILSLLLSLCWSHKRAFQSGRAGRSASPTSV